jgi:pimeloyl-ACP methyl ester carboxylesterase
MPRAATNGIELEYDSFGRPSDRPLVLVMGLGAQMILWDEDFCGMLAERRFHVVRFDNRDVGLSTKLDDAGVPNVFAAFAAAAQRQPIGAPYLLSDMADDTVGLLDAIGLESAHVVGASMGGMISQTLAIRHPHRMRSLTSIMSSTGNPTLPGPTPEAMSALTTPAPMERAAAVEHAVKVWSTIGGGAFGIDEDYVRARAARQFDRGVHPAGMARQLVAILASGDRRPALSDVRVPTLLVHGDADPLVPIAGGRDTAEAIPGAELLVIEGMAHDLPKATWPTIVDAIAKHAERAEGAR